MKAFALSDLPPALQKQALAQLASSGNGKSHAGQLGPKRDPRGEPKTIEEARDRLRQKKAPMNKTEAAFFEYLKAKLPTFSTDREPITLKLGNGVRYTPDFVAVHECGERGAVVYAYEVKGHMRDDAAVKLKVAAAAYPWITFYLVTRAPRGTWIIQSILS